METITATRTSQSAINPALLAFVKCHLTSFARWDVLRLLASQEGRWLNRASLQRQLSQQPPSAINQALRELSDEGLVQLEPDSEGITLFRLDPSEPTSRVVERLIGAAAQDHQIRQLIVARILHGDQTAA